MHSKEFSRICKDYSGISDEMTIETQPDQAYFYVESDKIGNGAIRLQNPDGGFKESNYRIDLEKPVKQRFSSNYLV